MPVRKSTPLSQHSPACNCHHARCDASHMKENLSGSAHLMGCSWGLLHSKAGASRRQPGVAHRLCAPAASSLPHPPRHPPTPPLHAAFLHFHPQSGLLMSSHAASAQLAAALLTHYTVEWHAAWMPTHDSAVRHQPGESSVPMSHAELTWRPACPAGMARQGGWVRGCRRRWKLGEPTEAAGAGASSGARPSPTSSSSPQRLHHNNSEQLVTAFF